MYSFINLFIDAYLKCESNTHIMHQHDILHNIKLHISLNKVITLMFALLLTEMEKDNDSIGLELRHLLQNHVTYIA